MQYRIALDPHLEVPASEFVAARNASHHAADDLRKAKKHLQIARQLAEKLGISKAESEALLDRFEDMDTE
jgi:hypothetical protein